VILRASQLGFWHEILAMNAIASHKPPPIVHRLGNYYANYKALASLDSRVDPSKSTSVDIVNFLAATFQWSGSQTQAALLRFYHCTGI